MKLQVRVTSAVRRGSGSQFFLVGVTEERSENAVKKRGADMGGGHPLVETRQKRLHSERQPFCSAVAWRIRGAPVGRRLQLFVDANHPAQAKALCFVLGASASLP